jgi:hypothetical protein
MSAIDHQQLRIAMAAILGCHDPLIGIRAAGSPLEAPVALLAERTATALAYTLSEASEMYPDETHWEIVSAETEIMRDSQGWKKGESPDQALPPQGRVFRDPAVIATFDASA